MRRFWWVAAIIFVCSLVVYTVGTGWISKWTVTSNVRHARRQLEVVKVQEDLQRAQKALEVHRDRVLSFAAIFPEPNFEPTFASFRQVQEFRVMFHSLAGAQSMDAAPTPQFMAATGQLKAYRVPSLSVMASTPETVLGVVVLITGILTALLMGVRFVGSE